ncbi:MAG TPA: uracil-DNA glycosylase [Albidovulum sp.]|uniref:uracil-DNA glycosylase n=1 Tax=Albidovulum sp. TaxID=1872424 RepID=UPI002C5D8AFA|nr:uracil-DNA glycosylase [Defluviimonas sp.]MCO5128342.1 uracil-DNA glycosylase [Paracoccaceae bacterium]HPE25481.1 uracil-DNA glycosylase [Albidovulum sp.]MCP5355785.1 uracil-DNA glycosylase [Paracoccaceae bacterium]MCP5377270.1 uracil-DNA glycosylase [Paracoccaceae bacterium]
MIPAAWAHLPFFGRDWPRIEAALAAETAPVFPPRDRIFAALEAAGPDAVRVVILGQDPYHTAGKADGLAFSIPAGFPGRLGSLGNIFKELEADLGVTRTQSQLDDWAAQGVLLLNTALSVPEGRPKGHEKLGWDRLVAEVLATLDTRPRAFLLWGGPAQMLASRHLTHPGHLRIETAHPSPLSAWRGFFGSHPFSQVNAWLEARGDKPVAWA